MKKLQPGIAVFNHVYSVYKASAKQRGLLFLLTKEEFKTLVESDCNYCGRKPYNILKLKKSPDPYTYNGIDRVDNSKGYLPENSVSCCKDCNYMKRNKTESEFREQITRIFLRYEK